MTQKLVLEALRTLPEEYVNEGTEWMHTPDYVLAMSPGLPPIWYKDGKWGDLRLSEPVMQITRKVLKKEFVIPAGTFITDEPQYQPVTQLQKKFDEYIRELPDDMFETIVLGGK